MENKDLLDVLSKLMAWVDATQPLIEALVTSHPDHQKLRDAWHARLPHRVEERMDTEPFGVESYREKLVQLMGDISGWLDELAARRTDEGSSEPGG